MIKCCISALYLAWRLLENHTRVMISASGHVKIRIYIASSCCSIGGNFSGYEAIAEVEGVADFEVSLGLRRIRYFYEEAKMSPLVWC